MTMAERAPCAELVPGAAWKAACPQPHAAASTRTEKRAMSLVVR